MTKNAIIDKIMNHPLCGSFAEVGRNLSTGKASKFKIYTKVKGVSGKYITLEAYIKNPVMTEEQVLSGMFE